jgi:hypothetical protein
VIVCSFCIDSGGSGPFFQGKHKKNNNLTNCTISSVVCQIILGLATLTLILFETTNKSTKLHNFNTLIAIGYLSHALPSSSNPGGPARVISTQGKFQVLYVNNILLGSLRSTSYNFRQLINRPNCTISCLVCQICPRLASFALIQLKKTNQLTKLHKFISCMSIVSFACYARSHTILSNL